MRSGGNVVSNLHEDRLLDMGIREWLTAYLTGPPSKPQITRRKGSRYVGETCLERLFCSLSSLNMPLPRWSVSAFAATPQCAPRQHCRERSLQSLSGYLRMRFVGASGRHCPRVQWLFRHANVAVGEIIVENVSARETANNSSLFHFVATSL